MRIGQPPVLEVNTINMERLQYEQCLDYCYLNWSVVEEGFFTVLFLVFYVFFTLLV